jgi:hypothetical protein
MGVPLKNGINQKLRKMAQQLWTIQHELAKIAAKDKRAEFDDHAITELKIALDNVRYLLWGHIRYSGSGRWVRFASGKLGRSQRGLRHAGSLIFGRRWLAWCLVKGRRIARALTLQFQGSR